MKVATVIYNARKPWASVRNGWEILAASELEQNNARIVQNNQHPNIIIIVGDYVVTMRNFDAWFIESPLCDYKYSESDRDTDEQDEDIDVFGGGNNFDAPDDLDGLCLFYLLEDPDGLTDDEMLELAGSSDRSIRHEDALLAIRRKQSCLTTA
jgi:hypothetical protein